MALILENSSGFPTPVFHCLPVNQNQDTVVSDDNNSHPDLPPSDQEIVMLQPREDDGSEQERDTRRISRVPCKARGVTDTSVPHTARNAFIDIPANAVHGMMLMCSHDVCAKTRRFRYCTVCGIPVAKRNFLKRHGHGLLKARQRVLVPDEPTSPDEERPAKKPRASPDPPPLPLVQPTCAPNKESAKDIESGDSDVMKVTAEERQLLELFRSRPKFAGPQTTDEWVQKILAVASANTSPPSPTPTTTSITSTYSEEPPVQFVMTDPIDNDDNNSVDEFIGKWFEEV